MPVFAVGTEGTDVCRTDKVPALLEFSFLGKGTRQCTGKQTSSFWYGYMVWETCSKETPSQVVWSGNTFLKSWHTNWNQAKNERGSLQEISALCYSALLSSSKHDPHGHTGLGSPGAQVQHSRKEEARACWDWGWPQGGASQSRKWDLELGLRAVVQGSGVRPRVWILSPLLCL